jgi:hypothetical protein
MKPDHCPWPILQVEMKSDQKRTIDWDLSQISGNAEIGNSYRLNNSKLLSLKTSHQIQGFINQPTHTKFKRI